MHWRVRRFIFCYDNILTLVKSHVSMSYILKDSWELDIEYFMMPVWLLPSNPQILHHFCRLFNDICNSYHWWTLWINESFNLLLGPVDCSVSWRLLSRNFCSAYFCRHTFACRFQKLFEKNCKEKIKNVKISPNTHPVSSFKNCSFFTMKASTRLGKLQLILRVTL